MPGKDGAHEKGGVESGIGFSRRNWMVPMPNVDTIERLNEYVLQKCVDDADRTVDGQPKNIGEAFENERLKMLAHPAAAMDSGVRKSGSCVDGYQTISFDGNRYSVPLGYVGKPLWFKAYWDRVMIGSRSEVIAEHSRCYGEDEYVLKPEHYFDLLERRPQAVQYARPLLQAKWPQEYWDCYKRMRSTMGSSKAGRDFVRILRLHSQHGIAATTGAILEALDAGALNADVVLQILDREKYVRRVFTERPELAIDVALADTTQYQQLLGGGHEHCAA